MKRINLIRKSVTRRQQVFNTIKRRKKKEYRAKEQRRQEMEDRNDAYKRAMGVIK